MTFVLARNSRTTERKENAPATGRFLFIQGPEQMNQSEEVTRSANGEFAFPAENLVLTQSARLARMRLIADRTDFKKLIPDGSIIRLDR
jgi:hypothetical protein